MMHNLDPTIFQKNTMTEEKPKQIDEKTSNKNIMKKNKKNFKEDE